MRIEPQYPPDALLRDCPITPAPVGKLTFWDAYDLAVMRKLDVRACNETRLQKLREWKAEGQTNDGA